MKRAGSVRIYAETALDALHRLDTLAICLGTFHRLSCVIITDHGPRR
jgi:hypothetical protein